MLFQKAKRHKVLVVEDEVLIADTLTYHLEENGFSVVGSAISYHEAVALFQQTAPDISIIDIRLSGPRSGIEFGAFLRQQTPRIPFIYLTSQLDAHSLEAAKATFPAGYLGKPVPLNSLVSTLQVALHNAEVDDAYLVIRDRGVLHRILPEDILYLEADHVYVRYYLADGRALVERSTLTD
ncbi:MAG: response regulator, partial [Bacteroidota bacterium]